jgi:RNA-directed DNA polymerase
MSREVHVRFCERRGVRFPPPTLLVVMVAGTRADAEALKVQAAGVLAPMGLRLSEAKTRITHIDEGHDFLGYRVQRHQKRGTGKRHVYTYPSKKALQAIKAKVRTISRQNRNQPLAVVLHRLNLTLRGWCVYFRHGCSARTFRYLGQFAWERALKWLRRKHPNATWKQLRRRYLPGWRPTDRSVELLNPEKVTIIRYRYRGQTIPTPWTPQAAGQRDNHRHEPVESPLRGDTHGGFGGRGREDPRPKGPQGVPSPPQPARRLASQQIRSIPLDDERLRNLALRGCGAVICYGCSSCRAGRRRWRRSARTTIGMPTALGSSQ